MNGSEKDRHSARHWDIQQGAQKKPRLVVAVSYPIKEETRFYFVRRGIVVVQVVAQSLLDSFVNGLPLRIDIQHEASDHRIGAALDGIYAGFIRKNDSHNSLPIF